MYCINCGAQNPDTGRFCIKCGTPLKAQEIPAQPTYAVPPMAPEMPVKPIYAAPPAYTGAVPKKTETKKSKKALLIGGIALVLVIAVVVGFFVFGNRRGSSDYMDVVDGIMAGYCEGDLDAMLGVMPEQVEEMLDDMSGGRSAMERQLRTMMAERDREYGKGWTVEYYIDEEEDYFGEDLDDFREEYEIYLDLTGIDAVKEVEVYSVILDAYGDEVEEEWTDIILIKIDGRWYGIPD